MSSTSSIGMRIGLGATILSAHMHHRPLDGLSVYTQRLAEALRQDPQVTVETVGFGRGSGALPVDRVLPGGYAFRAGLSLMFDSPFAGTRDFTDRYRLFHAPDLRIPRLRGIPLVATVHDLLQLRHPHWVNPALRGLKNLAFKRILQWPDHVITGSQSAAHDIVEGLNWPATRVTVIPNGVGEEFFQEIPADRRKAIQAGLGIDRPFLLSIGTLQPRKNIERVIVAYKSLPEAMRKGIGLVVIGNRGWSDDAVVKELEDLQASGKGVWLRGVTNETLRALLQSATALVFPSLHEGFGLPVLEAFASGTPVITSTTSSLPEVAGDAAILVDPTSSDAIADAMHRVVTDTTLGGMLVLRGRARASTFTWRVTAQRTIDVYRTLL